MSKTVYHVCGGSERNYGDFALVKTQRELIEQEYGEPLNWKTLEIKEDRPIQGRLLDEINKSDMLLIGGGGLIMPGDGFETLSGWQFNIAYDSIYNIRVPVVVHAIGYNLFPGEEISQEALESLGALQEVAILFSVRNNGSKQKLLESEELDQYRGLDVCPDPGIFTHKDSFLHPFLEKRLENAETVIGLNLAGDRQHSRFMDNEIESMVCKINEVLQTIPNCSVLYVPHVSIYDMQFVELLKKNITVDFINLAEVCPWLYPETPANVSSIASIYNRCDIVLGMRGHSCMIPFGQGTPCIPIGNHNKGLFFAADMGGRAILNDCYKLKDVLHWELYNEERKKERQSILDGFRSLSDEFVSRIVGLL
jgi:polysaccharide pyruvyl transferase WcaK-like protein